MTIYIKETETKVCGNKALALNCYDYDSSKAEIFFSKAFFTKIDDCIYVCGQLDNISGEAQKSIDAWKQDDWAYFTIHTKPYMQWSFKNKKEIERSVDAYEKFLKYLIDNATIMLDAWYEGLHLRDINSDLIAKFIDDPEKNEALFDYTIQSVLPLDFADEEQEISLELEEGKKFGGGNYKKVSVKETLADKEDFIITKLNELDTTLEEDKVNNFSDYAVARTKISPAVLEIHDYLIDLCLKIM